MAINSMMETTDVLATMSMKTLRHELSIWGRYWRAQEYGRGFARRSACDRLGETHSGSNVHEMATPKHIAIYDGLIDALSLECRRALRAQYICKKDWALLGFESKKSHVYWLRRAEGALLD
ncbi:hypothetical protein [uncultured Shewanella sp.]|uniref:hypothetical protein n=1 Tax=uncultured Shewanella sp. TaxID=173975 RepID=UPI00262ADEE7|nr:hypothetical protein [uncultured Shewanella sp.]